MTPIGVPERTSPNGVPAAFVGGIITPTCASSANMPLRQTGDVP